MARDSDTGTRPLTVLLLALAGVAVEIASDDHRPWHRSVGIALAWLAPAMILTWRLGPAGATVRPPRWVGVVVACSAAVPFGWDAALRSWLNDGLALELQMVQALRNMGYVLAACACWHGCARLACVVSLFLMLFASVMTEHRAVQLVLVLYSLTGGAWLLLTYWFGLQHSFKGTQHTTLIDLPSPQTRWPWGRSVLFGSLLVGASTLVVVGPKQVTHKLGEWLPTSGGTGATDLFARSGLGDGPEEVAGDNPLVAGMVDSQKMIEDNERSLIDVVSDMYGPPHKPKKDQERMVAGGLAEVIQNHGKIPENRRPSRDFATGRQGPTERKKVSGQGARGVLEVAGRTPLHIRLIAYDTYDGATAQWQDAPRPSVLGLDAHEQQWMHVRKLDMPHDWYDASESHQLKVADLKRNIVPTPPLLERFRINRVDRADYYNLLYDGVFEFAGRRTVPPGVIVHCDSRTIAVERLPETAFMPANTITERLPAVTPLTDDQRAWLTPLAHAWTAELPRGGAQVAALINHLQSHFTLDRTASAPVDHPDPIRWFLTESQRGPDYLFASAAVLLLRALDYPTRLCLGYYAAPEAYDSETEHTPVRADDLHFWPEVRLRDSQWIVLEPTPGYASLTPRLPWLTRVQRALQAGGQWATQHALALSIAVLLVLAVWWFRQRLIDAVATRWWYCTPGRHWRVQVQRVVQLIERRACRHKRSRPVGQTFVAWLPTLSPDATWRQFADLATAAAYSPVDFTPPNTDVLALCRRVLALEFHPKEPPHG